MGLGAAAAGYWLWPDEGLWNPCRALPTPERLARHELVQAAWSGIDPEKVRDVHVHLAGVGSGGLWVNPALRSLAHPFEYVHGRFYANAACMADGSGAADEGYVARLLALLQDFPSGVRLMLLAMDYFHDEAGNAVLERSVFHVSNEYAQRLAQRHPGRFEWIASIHPYRPDCVAALEGAVARGARALKWIPSAMGIDPASPRCDRFYEALRRLDVPLLTHGGYEHPLLRSGAAQELNSPLALRRPLEHGVRVIVAHCASSGESIDTDRGAGGPRVHSFALFARLMDEPGYQGRLFGDISALPETSRVGTLLATVLQRGDWQERLVNGSDYPLPGYMPAFSLKRLEQERFLSAGQAQVLREIRQFNPLLFDLVMKRHIAAQGKRFAASVFETAAVFGPGGRERGPAAAAGAVTKR